MALITYADKSTMNENASVPAVNKVQASDMNEIKNVVNDINRQLLAYFEARYKTLWTGSWSSGNLTVSGISNYNSIIVYVDNNDAIVCHKNGTETSFQGVTILGSGSTFSQYSKIFICGVNGDTLTWSVGKELGHNASGNHNAGSNKTVSKIVGLDPIIEWT